ncbi:urease accessory protein UreD [Mesorhizobium sp. YR577]|uniref:urease accessory protein UreD n=1 Tax=Mesorhizobium sp. YR577 TaxID=1884373 RepID=UPI0008EAAD9B|nr:urease accessory protein UreD [Mesorhizobium sp. YR577]SFU18970.1 urease accessory protein [Mesorhizobium sp. YR577]
MMQHWRPDPVPRHDLAVGARHGRFDLEFRRDGDRSCIGRQFVSYPFHFTRPFALDPAIPSLLTVYQQSSSGGLYRSDRLTSRLELKRGAGAHVTTQAATVVHDCQGLPASQTVGIEAGEGSFLAYTPDPLILFPGAALTSELSVRLAEGAVVLLQDAFATHDPAARDRMFDTLASDIVVSDARGRTLVLDRSSLKGAALAGDASPVGAWTVCASFMLLGPAGRLPGSDQLAAAGEVAGAIVGVSSLPNAAGWCVRCLAQHAIAARAVSDGIFNACVAAAFGVAPAPRRK